MDTGKTRRRRRPHHIHIHIRIQLPQHLRHRSTPTSAARCRLPLLFPANSSNLSKLSCPLLFSDISLSERFIETLNLDLVNLCCRDGASSAVTGLGCRRDCFRMLLGRSFSDFDPTEFLSQNDLRFGRVLSRLGNRQLEYSEADLSLGGVLSRLGNRQPEFADDNPSLGRFSGRLGAGVCNVSNGELIWPDKKKRLKKRIHYLGLNKEKFAAGTLEVLNLNT